MDIAVGVAYDTDLNTALSTIEEVLRSNPRVLKEPAAAIGVSVLADSSIDAAVKPWTTVADFGPAGGEINKAIVEAFRNRKIVIPLPQHEVRMLGNAT
jgi:small conductance mechanosensitive channel